MSILGTDFKWLFGKLDILEMLFPSDVACIFCGNEALLDKYHVCEKCTQELIEVDTCDNILSSVSELDDMLAVFRYSGNVAEAIKRFKYRNCPYLGKEFSRFMEIKPEWRTDFIVPVPLHRSRERARGYNQCRLLAEGISERYGIPINENALKRIHKTRKQALLETEERQTNLRGAFEAFESECSGKAVLLIDDVCTTGNTLRECARELKIKGATHVYALVFALSKVN